MTTAVPLSAKSKKDLADLARRRGVRGWETMSKDALIRVLSVAAPPKIATAKPAPAKASKPAAPAARTTAKPVEKVAIKPAPKAVAKPTKSAIVAVPPAVVVSPPKAIANGSHKLNGAAKAPGKLAATPSRATGKPAPVTSSSATGRAIASPTKPAPIVPGVKTIVIPPVRDPAKDLSSGKTVPGASTKDRILLMVPDPYWLHAYWELTNHSVSRAEAALKQDWHGARPTIRLFDVTSIDTTSTSETPVRDIVIHGGCNNWYIDVPQPPRQYRADIGYVSRRGDFFVLARSNVVTPPKAGSTEAIEVGWGDMDVKKAERILAMSTGFESSGNPELKELFEERLRRPMGAPKETAFGTGAVLPATLKKFHFEIDAHLVVNGKTDPAAHVTLQNEPVKLRPDGSFTMLFSLPDSRQIIPAVATSADGVEERTIVLAVERNTKHLDPMIHDQMNEN